MNEHLQPFKHSGSLGKAPYLIVAGSLLCAVVIGLIYGCLSFVPLIYLRVILLIGCAFAVSFPIGWLGRKFHCREPYFLGLMGFVSGAVVLYVSWCTFVNYFLRDTPEGSKVGLINVLLSPLATWHVMTLICAQGWFQFSGTLIQGPALAILWILEALLVVIGPGLVSSRLLTDSMYCEACERFCEQEPLMRGFAVPPAALKKRILEGELAALNELERHDLKIPRRTVFDLHVCGGCKTIIGVRIKCLTKVADKNGQLVDQSSDESEMLQASPEFYRTLKDRVAELYRRPRPGELGAPPTS